MSGKFGDLINQARQQDGKPDIKKDGKTETQHIQEPAEEQVQKPDLVTLNIKTERKYRDYWMGQAKMRGTTMKSVIEAHLTDLFGVPE